MKNNNLFLALIIPSILIAGSIVTATNIATADRLQIAKSVAVQGCYEATTGLKRVTSEDKSETTIIDETQINRDTLQECMTLKGF